VNYNSPHIVIKDLALLNEALRKLGLQEIRLSKGLDISKPCRVVFTAVDTMDNHKAIDRTKRTQ
jgi:hypothetical protein